MLKRSHKNEDYDFVTTVDFDLRYHFKIDPETLTDAQWCDAYAHLERIRKQEAKRNGL